MGLPPVPSGGNPPEQQILQRIRPNLACISVTTVLVIPTVEPIMALDFNDYYTSHFSRLAAAMTLLAGDSTTGEELAQEAFVRAFEHWPD